MAREQSYGQKLIFTYSFQGNQDFTFSCDSRFVKLRYSAFVIIRYSAFGGILEPRGHLGGIWEASWGRNHRDGIMGEEVWWTNPPGGMFVWVRIPTATDTRKAEMDRGSRWNTPIIPIPRRTVDMTPWNLR